MSDAILPFVFFGFGGLVALFLALRRRALTEQQWSATAARMKLQFIPSSLFGKPSIHGVVDGFGVQVETFSKSQGKTRVLFTRVTINAVGKIPSHVTLKREGAWAGLRKVFTGEDVQIADDAFDSAVNVDGPEQEVLALLSHGARRQVLRLVNNHAGEIKNGCVVVERRGATNAPGELERLIRELLSIARGLPYDSVPQALFQNATSDPNHGVRLRNLKMLFDGWPGEDFTGRALEAALNDASPAVRLYAAPLAGGERAVQHLSALVRDETAPEEIRIDALSTLLERAKYPEVAGVVSSVLSPRYRALSLAAMEAVGRNRDVAQLDKLVASTELREPAMVEAAATALGLLRDRRAEERLLQLLAHDSLEVKRAAATALGRAGTVRAVEPLLALTEGLFADGALKDAARDSVRRIQGRLGDADAGRLSLAGADGSEGALSVTPEGGELSVATKLPDKS